MRIIDTHQHLWDTNALSYPWLDGFDALSQKYTIADYRKASAGIDVAATVHVEANPAPGSEVAEAARLTQLAQENGLVGAIVASAPLEEPNVAEMLRRLCEYPLVVGVRRMAWHREDPDFYRDPNLIKGVRALAEYNLTFDLC
ncbi:MAG: amidohydrolase, partial [Candidatus Latescibacteria bacterium]|nr:amidohydrolase [Candidatus Latescibacterota bacterium]